jgi:siroheme synthase (precorrin-2 oxidase/ferrochelatase)
MNQATNKFYVYEHLKKDTKEVFYVGKGCRNRHSQKDNRNKFWHNIVNKHGFEVRFVAKELDEELAFLVEEERIDQLKRLDIKLCNLTNGGEGSSGLVLSEEVKQLVSKRFKGKKLTEEHRKKCSDSLKKVKKTKEWVEKIAQKLRGKKRDLKDNVAAAKAVSKPVICIDTNERFESGRAAANKYEISPTEISRACTGKALFAAGKKWRFE